MRHPLLIFFASLPALSPAIGQPRLPVKIVGAAQEQLAKRLAAAVSKELERDSRFELAEHSQAGVLTISLPAGVGWERRLDWTEIHYQARLTSANGRSQVIAGHCWNWNLTVCARQIIDAAAQFGST